MSVLTAAPVQPIPDDEGKRGVRVLLVDHEEIVQWGFRLLLGHQAWAERCLPASDADTALDLARRFAPHVALIGTGTLQGEPAAFCRALADACRTTRVLLLTHADAVPASTVRASGATGFVSRTWPARDLLHAIRMASVGRTAPVHRPSAQSALSGRQQEILQLIADGATNSEIARRLYLSHHTVKQHTSALYRKLGARNRTHAVQTARRQGLLAS